MSAVEIERLMRLVRMRGGQVSFADPAPMLQEDGEMLVTLTDISAQEEAEAVVRSLADQVPGAGVHRPRSTRRPRQEVTEMHETTAKLLEAAHSCAEGALRRSGTNDPNANAAAAEVYARAAKALAEGAAALDEAWLRRQQSGYNSADNPGG